MRVVAVRQILLRNILRTAETFGDVLAGEFEVNSTRMGSFGAVNLKKCAYLFQDAVEWPGFVSARGLDGVAVHGIAGPNDMAPFARDPPQHFRECFRDFIGAKTAYQRQAPGLVLRVEKIDQPQQLVFRE